MRASLVAGLALGGILLGGALMVTTLENGGQSRSVGLSAKAGLVSAAHAIAPPPTPAGPRIATLPKETITASITIPADSSGSAETPVIPTEPSLDAKPRGLDVRVARGDTLMKLLTRNAVAREQAHAAVTALRPVYDLKRMRIGQTFSLVFAPAPSLRSANDETKTDLLTLSFRPSVDQDIILRRGEEGEFKADVVDRPLERLDAHADGRISTSLYDAAMAAKLPVDVMMRLIQVFSFDVDFQREVQPGDRFAVLYEEFRDELGEPVRSGKIAWASMTLSGKTLEYARHAPKGGFADYYDRKGRSVKKTLMRTPINGARLSSRFGKRRHPVLGYTKVHRGVDFAAPKGVPIMAAGDGVIESIGRNGGYGKYIRIRHNSTYKTAYAHMSSYKRGLKKGTRVRQGSTIGYVGSTGRSTGPHLHYEVLKNGRQTNPMSVRLPAGDKLKGKALKRFLAGWPEIDRRVRVARGGQDVASD